MIGAGKRTVDSSLVERLRDRDEAALEDLISVHGARMYRIAMQFMRNEHDADEVVQDALLAIWKKIGTFEGRAAFRSWSYRVTANVALMALRKKRQRESAVGATNARCDKDDESVVGLADGAEPPDEIIARAELCRLACAMIDRLNEPYRTTVILRDVKGFGATEIAEMSTASATAVRSRLHRGRLMLRRELRPYLKCEEETA